MRQYLVLPLLLAVINLSGCFWNTKLPYQESMTTYVESSTTLMTQARTAAEPYQEACKSYRRLVREIGPDVIKAPSENQESNEAPKCSMEKSGDYVLFLKANADVAIMYQDLIARHSPEGESRRGSEAITNAGSTISSECAKEGSRCNADWITGPRLTVIEDISGKLFSAYASTQSHEGLREFLEKSKLRYASHVTNVADTIHGMKKTISNVSLTIQSFNRAYCEDKPTKELCGDEQLRVFESKVPDTIVTLENMEKLIAEHLEAHNTFHDEVLENDTSDARRQRLKDMAKDVVRLGVDIDQAF